MFYKFFLKEGGSKLVEAWIMVQLEFHRLDVANGFNGTVTVAGALLQP